MRRFLLSTLHPRAALRSSSTAPKAAATKPARTQREKNATFIRTFVGFFCLAFALQTFAIKTNLYQFASEQKFKRRLKSDEALVDFQNRMAAVIPQSR